MRGRKRTRLEKDWLARKTRTWNRRHNRARTPLAEGVDPAIKSYRDADSGEVYYLLHIHPVIVKILCRPSKWPFRERRRRRHEAVLRRAA